MTGRSTLLSLFLQPDTVGQLSARTFLLSGVCVALLGSIKLCILPMYNGNPEGGLSERLCLCLRLRTCQPHSRAGLSSADPKMPKVGGGERRRDRRTPGAEGGRGSGSALPHQLAFVETESSSRGPIHWPSVSNALNSSFSTGLFLKHLKIRTYI